MHKWKSLLKSPLWHLFWGEKYRNSYKYAFLFITNILAALLEGVSYAFILLAFSVISTHQVPDFSSYKFLSHLSLNEFLTQFSEMQLFIGFILTAIFAQIFRSSLSYFTSYQSNVIAYQLLKKVQKKIYSQIFRMTFSFTSRYKTGDLVEHIRTPTNYFSGIMNHLNNAILNGIMVLICFGMMLLLEYRLTIIAFCLYGGYILLQKFVLKKISFVSKDQATEHANFSKHIVQNMQSIRTLHLYNQVENAQIKSDRIFDTIAKSTKRVHLWNSSIPALNEFFGIALVGVILVIGASLFHSESQSTLSSLLTFLIIAYRMSTKSQTTLASVGTISTYFGNIYRLNEILIDDGKEFSKVSGNELTEFNQSITFNNVTFSYTKNTPPALSNISFTIKKGETTALVGLSGSGKSTTLDLLMRLYEPTSGQICIDGQPINQYSPISYRSHFGVVCQDVCLFNETIEENILFGHVPLEPDEALNAAKISGAHEFIQKLPKGYQTIIGERGHKLSGGEKQRLSLARAVIRKPQILILDEATSHLDSHSESLFQKALEKFRIDRTVIIVAHRLSTIMDADKIIVVEHGKIIEHGTHQTLLDQEARYSSLWNKQRGTKNPDETKLLYESTPI